MISRTTVQGTFATKKLGELVDFLDSLRRPVTESERVAGPYPYYGANGKQGTINGFLFDEPLLLLAEDGGHFENPERGIAYRIEGKVWVNNHAHVLRAKKGIDLAFLCRVLENYDVTPFVTGTTRGKLTKAGASEIPIPVPTFGEQRRLAAILDKADALRTKRKDVLLRLDGLGQSIFADMFGTFPRNPNGWPVKRIDEVAECLDRIRRPITESARKPGPVPYYGANGQQGWVDSHLFDESLVLVAEDGGHFEDPKRGVAYRVDGKSWVNNHAHILRPRAGVVDVEYLHRSLRHYDFVPYISGTTRAKLTQGQLISATVMVPPIALQRQFSERMASLGRLRGRYQSALVACASLFASLQHRAFKGEL